MEIQVLCSNLWSGGLSTDDANDSDNTWWILHKLLGIYAKWTIQDYVGSWGFMSNKSKSTWPPSLSCLNLLTTRPVFTSIRQTMFPPHVATTPVSSSVTSSNAIYDLTYIFTEQCKTTILYLNFEDPVQTGISIQLFCCLLGRYRHGVLIHQNGNEWNVADHNLIPMAKRVVFVI